MGQASNAVRAELIKAIGEELTLLAGHIATRLTATLATDATTATVESTYLWPDAGTVYVEGLDTPAIEYTGKTATSLTGLTRSAYETQTAEVGAVCVEGSQSYSAVDRAHDELYVARAAGQALDRMGQWYGIPRPGAAWTDDHYRYLIETWAYLDRGTWWAVWKLADAWTAPFRMTGETNITGQTITDGTAPFAAHHVGRYVRVTDTDGTARVHRIVNMTSTALTLSANNGPYWVAADYANDDYAWEMLGFLIETDADVGGQMPGLVRVYLTVTGISAPPTYVQDFDEADYAAVTPPDLTDGGSVDLETIPGATDAYYAGYAQEDETVDGADTDPAYPIYLIDTSVLAFHALLEDTVPAQVRVETVTMAA